MKKTTRFFTAALITGTILLSFQPAGAQEWRVLIDNTIFKVDRLAQSPQQNHGNGNDWLATQTPLLKNTPVTSADTERNQSVIPRVESSFSQLGSWAPLQSAPGQESFQLFTF